MSFSNRLDRGLKTPSHSYYDPILLSLVEQGGRAKTQDLYEPVRAKMEDLLNDYDYEQLTQNNSPEPRWKNTMRVARDEMVKLGLLKTRKESGWGYWAITDKGRAQVTTARVPPQVFIAEEVADPTPLIEGAVRKISVNAYERDPDARGRCIKHHGTACCICNFSFGEIYGEVAEGFIHVHHVRSLSDIGGEYVVDPVEDLRPVCPNCHAVLHRRTPAYSIEEVRRFLQ